MLVFELFIEKFYRKIIFQKVYLVEKIIRKYEVRFLVICLVLGKKTAIFRNLFIQLDLLRYVKFLFFSNITRVKIWYFLRLNF